MGKAPERLALGPNLCWKYFGDKYPNNGALGKGKESYKTRQVACNKIAAETFGKERVSDKSECSNKPERTDEHHLSSADLINNAYG